MPQSIFLKSGLQQGAQVAFLKPCPLCGQGAELMATGQGNHFRKGRQIHTDALYSIRCPYCRFQTIKVATKEDAVALWNRRISTITQAQFIKGPWKYYKDYNGNLIICATNSQLEVKKILLEISSQDLEVDDDVAEATVRLMAAAPAMYARLQEVEHYTQTKINDFVQRYREKWVEEFKAKAESMGKEVSTEQALKAFEKVDVFKAMPDKELKKLHDDSSMLLATIDGASVQSLPLELERRSQQIQPLIYGSLKRKKLPVPSTKNEEEVEDGQE